MYYCRLCGAKHQRTSKLGVKHMIYEGKTDCGYCDDFRKAGYLHCLHCGGIVSKRRKGE